MEFSIERAALLKAVAQAQSVVERRNTIPILANVLIEAEGDQVSFRATDLDIEVVDLAAAKVSRAGSTSCPARAAAAAGENGACGSGSPAAGIPYDCPSQNSASRRSKISSTGSRGE